MSTSAYPLSLIKRLAVAVSAAAILSVSFGAALAEDAAATGCTDVVLVGKIIRRDYSDLPAKLPLINMDVRWILDVAVKQVLKGDEPNKIVQVIMISDATPMGARGDVFDLRRRSDGKYDWQTVPGQCRRYP